MITKFHKITAGPFQENGYIVHADDTNDCLIIDPGDNPEQYISTIESNELNPIAIMNTHGHIDHIHAVQPLKDYFSIPFIIHKNDEFIVEQYPKGCLMYGLKPNNTPEVDRWLNDENELIFGKFSIKIIHTPGHTPGGLCYKINDDVFTGDTLFKGSIGRTDFPGGDYATLIASLKKLVSEIPPETKVHAGHGCSTTIQQEIESNPFLAELDQYESN